MTVNKCISVSREFEDLAREYHCSWSEAARIGMSVMLADKGVREYDNTLNLHRKMTAFRIQAEQALSKIAELEEKQKSI